MMRMDSQTRAWVRAVLWWALVIGAMVAHGRAVGGEVGDVMETQGWARARHLYLFGVLCFCMAEVGRVVMRGANWIARRVVR